MLIPKDNVKDLQEIPDNVKSGLVIFPVYWSDVILPIALVKNPMKRFEEMTSDVKTGVIAHPNIGNQTGSAAS